MMRERAVTGIAAGLFAAAALGAPAAAAPAAEGDPDDCPMNAVCFWTEPGFEGEMTVHRNPGLGCDAVPEERARSVANHLPRPVWLYADGSCEEFVQALVPGESVDFIVPLNSWR